MANMGPNKKHNRKARLLAQFGPICQICGKTREPHELNLDHIIPKSVSGDNGIHNLRLTCPECNYARHH